MAEHHLQLHGQPLGNGKEANSSWVGGGGDESGWPELKKVITQEHCQGKDFSSTLIQLSKLHTKLMTNLFWLTMNFSSNHIKKSEMTCLPEWCVSPVITKRDIDTRILEQQWKNNHPALLTAKQKGSPPKAALQVDINPWMVPQ